VGTKFTGICVVAVLVLTGGCGVGRGRLSAREYVKESSAVCTRANRAVSRVHVPDLRDAKRADRATARVVAIHRASVGSLRDLRPPKDYEHTAKVWIALVDQALDELDGMRQALRDGDPSGAVSYANKATELDHRSQRIAREYGITPCRVPALTA
jgi:hypothetical protein